MRMNMHREDTQLTIYFDGEIDHHTLGHVRDEIDAEILRLPTDTLILDFAKVPFMDSSGIGLIMGRWKLMSKQQGKVVIAGARGAIRKVMELSGIKRIAQMK